MADMARTILRDSDKHKKKVYCMSVNFLFLFSQPCFCFSLFFIVYFWCLTLVPFNSLGPVPCTFR
ncbi:hypothetical protein Ahy_A05g022306 isoform B [Arachis hypogaea]|uniref:Uncharacterized protein n=1 Tax=Arachis hypogaea TaxID=3818 RepID=A0A445D092_ARAHY|nr:hypothetical protein Ahy_A05g022306 isoform B [Arachis hypogaea]